MPRRILVVDDNQAALFAVAEYFKCRRFDVDSAAHALDAKAMLRAVEYVLVITDLRLTEEGREGFEIIRYAKHRHPRTRVILMTAHATPDIESEAQGLGVDAVLYKPVPLLHLEHAVRELLPKRAGTTL